MRVGFQGGSSIFELGEGSDMICFFSLIKRNLELSVADLFLLDRLIRRYLHVEELEGAVKLMLRSKACFSGLCSDLSELKALGWCSESSFLNPNCANLATVFNKYFEGFELCVRSALDFYEQWNLYKPVRIITCDMPEYFVDKLRPLDDYDRLAPNESPFWLRPKLT